MRRLRQPAVYLAVAGGLLSAAMAVSYVECTTTGWQTELFREGVDLVVRCPECRARLHAALGPVPILHIVIHTLEQVGIYVFLTALACLDYAARGLAAEIRWSSGLLRVPYCHPPP